MIDSTDNRLPHAADGAFTQEEFTDPLVQYYNLIAADNEKQGAEMAERMRLEELASGIRHAPYYVYYKDGGGGANTTAGKRQTDQGAGSGKVSKAVSDLDVSRTHPTAADNNSAAMSFLLKAKQKITDKIDSINNEDKRVAELATHTESGVQSGDGSIGARSNTDAVKQQLPMVSMIVEEFQEGDSHPPPLDDQALSALVTSWADEGSVDSLMREIFRALPAAYGNSSDEIKCERLISTKIEELSASKHTLDAAFRQELHVYQKKALPAIPIIEDTCEALDSCQGESRYTLRMLKRTRLQAAGKVRLIALHEHRNRRRRLIATLDSVRTWQSKTESVCRNILSKHYAAAALPLGAWLRPRSGKYFGQRKTVDEDSFPSPKPTAANSTDVLHAHHGAMSSSSSAINSSALTQSSAKLRTPTGQSRAPKADKAENTQVVISLLPKLMPVVDSDIKAVGVYDSDVEGEEDEKADYSTDSGDDGNLFIAAAAAERDGDPTSEDEATKQRAQRLQRKIEKRLRAERKRRAAAEKEASRLSAREIVLSSYYKNKWDACDSANDDLSFEDFLMGASTEVQSLACGMISLGHYYSLRQIAGKVIGVCVRDDVEILLTSDFNKDLLLNTLKGLHALHIRQDHVANFFLELIDPILSAKFRSALCDVVGEDAGSSWEEVARSLIPSELHPCTLSLLANLAETLRNVMKLALACGSMVEEQKKSGTAFGSEAEGSTVYEGCKFLAGISARVAHRCFGAIVSYGSHANFKRGNVADCLHVYRLLHLFVLMCSSAVKDKSAAATNGSLRFQWQGVYTDHFRANTFDEVLKVMQSESFSPFPVNAGDFQELAMLFEKQDEEEAKETFTKYLQLRPSTTLADSLEEHLRLDTAPNPFTSGPFTSVSYQPVEALTDRKPFSLFEDGHVIFTFSSFLTCRAMIEAVNNAKGLASAAGEMLLTIHGLASAYIDFICTHFVATSESEPLDCDLNTPQHIQGYFSLIRSTSSQIASTCPAMVSSGFPYLGGAPSHAWKVKAMSSDSNNPFATLERATAIASLDTVALCHRLCVQALTGLLNASELSTVADANESISGATKYASQVGLRKLAKSLTGVEQLVTAVEKSKWDGAVSLGAQQSGYTSLLLGELDSISLKVKGIFKGMPPKAASMLMQHCVFNVMLSFVDGLSRVKKYSEAGKVQALTDALYVTKAIKERYPHTSPRLLEYVMGYARAVMGQWQDVLQLLNDHHALYTARQLIVFGDREGFMKKREVSNILDTLCHEDKLPLFLIDAL